jgi:hypothetical protein
MIATFDEAVAEARNSEAFRSWGKLRLSDLEQSNAMKDEKHYAPSELATIWGVSVQTIREIFKGEEGVLKIGRDGTRSRRRYKTLRFPESVAERVHTRLSA